MALGHARPPLWTAEAGRSTGPEPDIFARSRSRVLVVDDNDRHLDIICTALDAAGFPVEACQGGGEAIRRLAQWRYAALVVDLIMPEVSGIDVIERLPDLAQNARTRAIICTANVTLARQQTANNACVTAYVEKPIELRTLIGAVRAACSFGDRDPDRPGDRRRDARQAPLAGWAPPGAIV
ncbi:MAG: response regulator [Hyphomonadaceae bacterium]